MIPQKVVAKETLYYHLPVYQIQQILNEFFIVLDWHLPEVDAGGKQRAQTLLHSIKSIAIGREIETLNLGEIGVC